MSDTSRFLFNHEDGRYGQYFAVLNEALTLLSEWLQTQGYVLFPETGVAYLAEVKKSLDLLRRRFLYEQEDGLLLDVGGSGLPQGYMFSRLVTDQQISEQTLKNSPSVNDLKRACLESLFQTGEMNPALLNQLAEHSYFEELGASGYVKATTFMCSEVAAHMDDLFGVTWAALDGATSMPAIYSMTFRVHGEFGQSELDRLLRVLRFESMTGVSVSVMASNIDAALNEITPVSLNRITLGPLHIKDVTSQTTVWSDVLKTYGKPSDFVWSLIIDTTHSVEAIHPSPLAVSFGVRPFALQVYAVDTSNQFYYERGAYRVEQVALLPHRVMQEVNDDSQMLEEIGKHVQFATYNEKGDLQ